MCQTLVALERGIFMVKLRGLDLILLAEWSHSGAARETAHNSFWRSLPLALERANQVFPCCCCCLAVGSRRRMIQMSCSSADLLLLISLFNWLNSNKPQQLVARERGRRNSNFHHLFLLCFTSNSCERLCLVTRPSVCLLFRSNTNPEGQREKTNFSALASIQ